MYGRTTSSCGALAGEGMTYGVASGCETSQLCRAEPGVRCRNSVTRKSWTEDVEAVPRCEKTHTRGKRTSDKFRILQEPASRPVKLCSASRKKRHLIMSIRTSWPPALLIKPGSTILIVACITMPRPMPTPSPTHLPVSGPICPLNPFNPLGPPTPPPHRLHPKRKRASWTTTSAGEV